MVNIDEFVLRNLFYHIPESDDYAECWWRETTDRDGYIILWDDGVHHHTYRYPPDLLTDWPG